MRAASVLLPLSPVLLLIGCEGPRSNADTVDSGAPEAASGAWWARVQGPLSAGDRVFAADADGFRAHSRAMGMDLRVDQEGGRVRAGSDEVRLRFEGWGREGDLIPVEPVSPVWGACGPEVDAAGACVRRVELPRPGVTEWWANAAAGAQQGWELEERPDGDGAVVLSLRVEGALAEQDEDRVLLLGDRGAQFSYSGLEAWDSDGQELSAWFQVDGDEVQIRVDDQDARWPIYVDPVTATAAVTWTGSAVGALMGTALGGGGDINGDGYDDVLVGSPGYGASTGVVYVYYGSATGPSSTADLTLSSPVSTAGFGAAVDIAGDVNKDGYDDVVIGGPNASVSATNDGAAWVYYGSASGLSSSSYTTLSGSASATGYFGCSVSTAGDVNGDGYSDVIVGEYGYSSSTGRAWVFAGSSSGVSTTTYRTLTGSLSGMRWGWAVSGGGDVQRDGYGDIAVGGPYYVSGAGIRNGRVLVYYGASTFFTTTPTTVTYTGTTLYQYGWAVSIDNDMNGDSYNDLLVGAPTGTAAGLGRVYYYKGSSTGVPAGATKNFDGPAAGSYFGAALAALGDTDGDGYRELLVGAPNYLTDAGYVGLYEGASAGPGSTTLEKSWTGSSGQYLGTSVGNAGDVHGDGWPDALIGAPGTSLYTGEAYIHYGGPDADGDGYLNNGSGYLEDCDDASAAINPAATEVCDASNTDEDCDGAGDESGASGESTWYGDGDGDGYGDPGSSVSACDKPSGYVSDSSDCDDSLASVNPGAAEVCDAANTDEDCDGSADDSSATGASTWYGDGDSDGYGDPADSVSACDAPSGYVASGADCDDGDASINPGESEICDASDTDEDCDGSADGADASGKTTWYADGDGDGYGDASATRLSCDQPTGYVAGSGDCDDGDDDINPGATEVCDASDADEDCDGSADGADASGKTTWYRDADGDGYGDPGSTISACNMPTGYVAVGSDCDDGDADVNPGEVEVCDAADTDEDCDGSADGADASGTSDWYADDDGDGYGDPGAGISACDAPSGYVGSDADCDDGDADINPGETEVCDVANTDEDCDGSADGADASGESTWYRDSDGDGYGDSAATRSACDAPSGYVAVDGDCDDGDADINPGQAEICDDANTDEDCDGRADGLDALGKSTWYHDGDGDSYGDPSASSAACDAPTGYIEDDTDCDDGDAGVNPGEVEVCDAADTDEDCDGSADGADALGKSTWYRDADGDRFGDPGVTSAACEQPSGYLANDDDCDDGDSGINPAATEVCDPSNTDEDCDGSADGADAAGKSSWYRDADADGYGDPTTLNSACDVPAGYVADAEDCDDANGAVNPGETEICDDADTDEDCDGLADDSSALGQRTWNLDADGDGYGDPGDALDACDLPAGYVSDDADCDDGDAGDHPGATEIIANGDDEDCDGAETCYVDDDDDGYRADGGATISSADADCADPGEALDGEPEGDCDDGDAAYNPGAEESDCLDPNDYNCDGEVGYADSDADGYAACEECDDVDAAIHPGATEIVGDGIDSDCDETEICFVDADDDGFTDGSGRTTISSNIDCVDAGEAGADAVDGDCDDAAARVNPDAAELCDGIDNNCDGEVDEGVEASVWYADEDGDGYGDPATGEESCDPPVGRVADGTDCDDLDGGINPGELEVCDPYDVDEDCNGLSDDETALGQSTWYRDYDGDGYGDAASAELSCELLDGFVVNDNDCDDVDAGDYPGADEEIGNGDDEDCDGAEICYVDADEDGYRSEAGDTVTSEDGDCEDTGEALTGLPEGDCDDGSSRYNPSADESDCADPNDYNCDGSVGYADSDSDGFAACEECDDADSAISPDAVELTGDAIDQDCDGTEICYLDADDDGYVDGLGGTVSSADVDCVDAFEAGWDALDGDCDDADDALSPGAEEVCDGIDNDCDVEVDEGVGAGVWYTDLDGDGYGDPETMVESCDRPDGAVSTGGDCDDSDPARSPGSYDVPGDGVDQDCDGVDAGGPDDTGDTGDTGETGETAETGDTGSGETGNPDESGLSQDTGEVVNKGGCGCSSADGSTNGARGALLLALGMLIARRRSREERASRR